jgi:hypothetical protein
MPAKVPELMDSAHFFDFGGSFISTIANLAPSVSLQGRSEQLMHNSSTPLYLLINIS